MTVRERVLQMCLRWHRKIGRLWLTNWSKVLTRTALPHRKSRPRWTREIEKRVAAYDRGEVEGEDAETVLPRMRSFLRSTEAGMFNREG